MSKPALFTTFRGDSMYSHALMTSSYSVSGPVLLERPKGVLLVDRVLGFRLAVKKPPSAAPPPPPVPLAPML